MSAAQLMDQSAAAEKEEKDMAGYDGLKKRKRAVLFGYSGAGFSGLQTQSGSSKQQDDDEGVDDGKPDTVEDALHSALVQAGAIRACNSDSFQKIGWTRSARTDRGVHAASQLVGAKLQVPGKELDNGEVSREDEEAFVQKVNSFLPAQVRCYRIMRVANNFNARTATSSRTYGYFLPTFVLQREGTHLTDLLAKLRVVLQEFVGTHPFHNFTEKLSPRDPRSARLIRSFTVGEETFSIEGQDMIRLTVKGQSFLKHHIRRMVGFAVECVRRDVTNAVELVRRSLQVTQVCSGGGMPLAPAEALFLDSSAFDVYNIYLEKTKAKNPSAVIREPIDFEGDVKPAREGLIKEIILPAIFSQDGDGALQAFRSWLESRKHVEFPPMFVDPKTSEAEVNAQELLRREDRERVKKMKLSHDVSIHAEKARADSILHIMHSHHLAAISRERAKLKRKKREQGSGILPSTPIPEVKEVFFKKNLLLPASSSASFAEEEHDNVSIRCSSDSIQIPPSVMSWTDKRLPPVFSAYHQKFERHLNSPTTVQRFLWPIMLSGLDCLAVAPTGSGKTLSFALPLASHAVSRAGQSRSPTTCLVLSPTRELAIQTAKVLKPFLKLADLLTAVVYGGTAGGSEDAPAGANVLVATPGRCLDLLSSKILHLSCVSLVCVDEADRMLQLGFKEDCERILAHIPPNRQLVLTTATWTSKSAWLLNPARHVVVLCDAMQGSEKMRLSHRRKEDEEEEPMGEDDKETALTIPNSSVAQTVHVCAEHKKPRKLIRHIEKIHAEEAHLRALGPMLVFCNKIKTVLFVYEFLAKQQLRVVALHGSMSQDKRVAALEQFRAGKFSILVATDVAGRGIHIANLQHVVNYDFPTSLAQYAHRVGRCGRKQGSTGSALSFFTRNLAMMAGDLVTILEASKQVVDPNLKELAEERKDFVVSEDAIEEEEDKKGEEAQSDSEDEPIPPVPERQPFDDDVDRLSETSSIVDDEDHDLAGMVGATPLTNFAAKVSSSSKKSKTGFKRSRGVRGGKKNKKQVKLSS